MLFCTLKILYIAFRFIYRFYKDTQEHVACKYKLWATDAEWLPANDRAAIEILKLDENGKQMIPEGTPAIVKSDFFKSVDMKQLSLSTVAQVHNFDDSAQYEFWLDWTKDVNCVEMWSNMATHNEWFLDTFPPFKELESPERGPVSDLHELRRKELDRPIVTSISRRPHGEIETTIQHQIGEFAIYTVSAADKKRKVGKIVSVTPYPNDNRKVKLLQYKASRNMEWKEVPSGKGRFNTVAIGKVTHIFRKLNANNHLPVHAMRKWKEV